VSKRKETKTMERLIDIKVTRHGTILEELEIVCPMTGFRMRLLVEHSADGSYRTVELSPS
jgi:hypothetical protein